MKYTCLFLCLFALSIADVSYGENNPKKDSIAGKAFNFSRLTFEPDSINTIKRTIWNQETAFTVNDEKCDGWEITVPTQVSLYGTQLKATPLKNIQVDSILGDGVIGLQLEPAGFLFADPMKVKLTIDQKYKDIPVIFFMSDENGNLSDVPLQKRDGNKFTIDVPHFSGLIGLVPRDIESLCVLSKVTGSNSIGDAEKLLSNNPKITTPPISYERKCDDEYSKMLSMNVHAMMEPEGSAIGSVLSNDRIVNLICTSEELTGLPEIVFKLSDQLVKKALNAIEEYKNQPDKFAALSNFAVNVSRANCLICSPNAEANSKKVFEVLLKYIKSNIIYYKTKISEEHDFLYFRMLTDAYADLSLLSGESWFDQSMEELKNLLRFELEIEAHVYRNSQGGDWTDYVSSITKGKVVLFFDFDYYLNNKRYPSPEFAYNLSGNGKFTTEGRGEHNDNDGMEVTTVVPVVFTKEYTLDLNLCEFKGQITCVSPGNTKEKWEGEEFYSGTLNYIHFTNTLFNELNFHSANKGKFDFTFQNKKELLVDDVEPLMRNDDDQTVRTEFYYKLIHKPK